ncbi:aminoacyl-tRNA hydrolase [Spiroplasma cantharicola]|uniref:Peptidyl-tRNA hydrolase n=1 Tax=Spiroplasma cantharicola TaxID=362837 RepID=A0A0M5KCR2_9MOLU|nr:aminoacyl-tRNA hydrolase [Spiroplasma cantharicola]ALD66906.1 peptidyl-tRNA hydrolase [Spiroplasma cantharicola]
MSKLIVGLGNPGQNYVNTRHNAGFIAIDVLLEKYGFQKSIENFNAQIFFSNIKGEKILFVKPQTFMNLSGEAIISILQYYKIDIKDFIVLHDDKDLELSKTRFRNSGSAGGHNGIKNIISHLKTENFNRLKIGIGNPGQYKIVDWVLSKMTEEEIVLIKKQILNISSFVEEFISQEDFKNIMNKFN